MAISGDTFSGFASATESIFGAIGQGKLAKGYAKAAEISLQNEKLSKESTSIKQLMTSREIYKTMGGQRADIAAAGLKNSGSAMDIVRSSAAEGALTKQLISLQGTIEAQGYRQEAESYAAQAQAAKAAKKGGILSGILKAAGTAAMIFMSDERMKTDVELVRRRDDGVGIYRFRYLGSDVLFEGVMAQEVAGIYPAAVTQDADGVYQVDYDMIGIAPRVIEEA